MTRELAPGATAFPSTEDAYGLDDHGGPTSLDSGSEHPDLLGFLLPKRADDAPDGRSFDILIRTRPCADRRRTGGQR